MPTNSSIALSGRPLQLEEPVNAMAKVLGLQEAQQRNEQNALKADEYRRGVARNNRMMEIANGWSAGTTDDQRASSLKNGGYFDEADRVEKGAIERSKAKAEVDSKHIETVKKTFDMMGQTMGWLKSNPTPENAQLAVGHLVTTGAIPQAKADEIMAKFQRDPSPQSIANIATMGYQAALAAKDQLPTIQTRNTGGSTDTLAIDPITGKPTVTGSVRNTQSPDSAATNARIAADNAAARAQSEQHFQAGQNAPQYMETEAGLVALPKKLPPGQAPSATVVTGPDGQPLGKPLKQIPVAANTAIITNSQNLNKAKQALSLLEGNQIGEMTGDPNATGWKGMLPGPLLNRMDPSGVDTRAAIADLGSMVLHDRSGAAVTASEYPRLQPFIPTATDDRATAAKKLKRFIQVYESENQALSQTYGRDQGYRPNPAASGAAPPPAAPTGRKPTVTNW